MHTGAMQKRRLHGRRSGSRRLLGELLEAGVSACRAQVCRLHSKRAAAGWLQPEGPARGRLSLGRADDLVRHTARRATHAWIQLASRNMPVLRGEPSSALTRRAFLAPAAPGAYLLCYPFDASLLLLRGAFAQEHPDEMRKAGYTAADLLDAGVDLWQLGRAGAFTVAELRQHREDLDATSLREAGFPPGKFERSGFGVQDLLDAGFTVAEVGEAGFTPKEIDLILNPKKKKGKPARKK